ncbi:MAG TPA: hypothetical protein VLG71_00055 [Candidatus Limnocylindria bacterium]|nr:hypothetical protein [Candidatus Limnocylindria bacterium]
MKKKLGATLLTLMLPLTAVETKRIPRSSHPPSLDHQLPLTLEKQLHTIARRYGPYSIVAVRVSNTPQTDPRESLVVGIRPARRYRRQEPPTPRTKTRLLTDLVAVRNQHTTATHSLSIQVAYGTPPPLGDALRAG